MSANDAKYTMVAAKVEKELPENCTLVKGCSNIYEGDVKHGGSVRILAAATPTIKKYTGGKIDDPEEAELGSLTMSINQADYFYFRLDKIDEVLNGSEVGAALLSEVKAGLAEAQDKFVASLATETKYKSSVLTISTPDDAMAALRAGVLQLRKNKVGANIPLYADISWEMYELLHEKAVEIDTDNTEILASGALKRIHGVYLRPSNNIHVANGNYNMMIRTHRAISFAMAVEEVEGNVMHPNYFGRAMRGLVAYGGKVVRPDQLYTLVAKAA